MTTRSYWRMFAVLFSVFLELQSGGTIQAQDESPENVVTSITMLTEVDVAVVAALSDEKKQNEFAEWSKAAYGPIEKRYANDKVARTVVVLLTLHPDRDADVVVLARPAIAEADRDAFLKAADPRKLPRSRFIDVGFWVVVGVNGGGPDKDKPWEPAIPTPRELRLAKFRKAGTAGRLAFMKHWAQAEMIPLLGALSESIEGPRVESVRVYGKVLANAKTDGVLDVDQLSEKDPRYWRALTNMYPKMPLADAVRVALLASQGLIEQAMNVAKAAAPFAPEKSGFNLVLRDFQEMAEIFENDVNRSVRKGIALHDAGKFDEALKLYGEILKEHPTSAWTLFETFQTQLGMSTIAGKDLPDWSAVRKKILAANPLYSSMAQASSAEDLYDLFLRKEMAELFQDRTKFESDILRYADIALELGQPGFAARIYWKAHQAFDKPQLQDRNYLEDFLYALDRCGVSELAKDFPGDHDAEFAKISARRKSTKDPNPAFKLYKPSGSKKF